MAIYKAYTKYVRITPRKARLVARALKGKSVESARLILVSATKRAAKPILKTLNSAVSNAVQKGEDKANLFIKTIDIGEGPRFKRWHAVARGMAHEYQKRTCHIKIILESKKPMKALVSTKGKTKPVESKK